MNDIAATPNKSDNEKYCSDCGKLINIKAEVCPLCGVRQFDAPIIVNLGGRNKLVAALLALFLGAFGVHKFYLGQVGWGFVYLLFCWTLIPTIVSFVEFILLLIMSDAEFNRRFREY